MTAKLGWKVYRAPSGPITVTNSKELKMAIARFISTTIDKRGLTQHQTAAIIGGDQPKVSLITRGKLTDFSCDRLLNYSARMGYQMTVTFEPIRPKRHIKKRSTVRTL